MQSSIKKIVLTPLLLAAIMLSVSACGDVPGQDGDGLPGPVTSIKFESRLQLNAALTDVWGYVEPGTGKEYALVGHNSGVFIVDASNPTAPTVIADVKNIPGFDIKVWQNYMYTVTGSGNGNGIVVDLTDIASPQIVGFFPSAHNIFISGKGYMFAEVPGLRILDLNDNPREPQPIWSTGLEGHDATVVGDRLYDFHGPKATNIYDISDINNPQVLGTITNHNLIRYHHSGWPTEDGNYLLICDEGSRGDDEDITMWDIRDPGNPEFLQAFKDTTAIVHNLYIIGDLAFVAYYSDGFKLFDVSIPGEFSLIDEYDTSDLSGDTFSGAFGIYPFAPSAAIYVSDSQKGLYIFSIDRSGTPKQLLF